MSGGARSALRALAMVCAWAAAGAAPACSCGGTLPAGMPDGAVVAPDAPPSVGGDAAAGVPRVVLSELVLSPQHDWSDGAGTPFDATPGPGSPRQDDQYVELENRGGDPVDLTGWVLEIRDSSDSRTVLGQDGVLAFTAGSSLEALAPGGFAVIGDPAGQASTDAYVVLTTAEGDVVDDVEIGGLSPGRDFEQDGVGDGAPDAEHNGFARGSFDEAIARSDGAARTGDDQADFVAMPATPLLRNHVDPPVDDGAPLGVVATAEGASFAVTDPLWLTFDEPLDPASVDAPGVVTVSAGGAPVALGFHTFAGDDATLVLNPVGRLPFDSDVTVTVAAGTGGAMDRAGHTLAAPAVFTVHTESAPPDPAPVRINELCASPRQDWNDSSGGGEPFDGVPGGGKVDSYDEWIELVSAAPGPVDLRGWHILLYEGPNLIQDARQSTRLGGTSPTVRVVGGGTLDAVQSGDRVVVGNPVGSLTPSLWIELRDDQGVLVDTVELGGNLVDDDRGGDGVANGAPAPGEDGSSTGPADEVVAREPDGADTGDDVADFDHAAATPGAPN